MARITSQIQDLRHLSWAVARDASGIAGSFLKSYDDLGPRKTYYKLSDYHSAEGIVGHECVNEIVVDRLLDILGVPHLDYRLIHARVIIDEAEYEMWLNASDDFKNPGESKSALDEYYDLMHEPVERPLAFCVHNGWGRRIWEMFVVDYLILNRDRHGANIEVLRNPRARTLRLAPLFDHGLSLLFRCRTDADVEAFDVMADLPVQSYLGTFSARRNLDLIPAKEFPRFAPLYEEDRRALFDGLEEVTTAAWRDAVWSMIWGRWKVYEALRPAQ